MERFYYWAKNLGLDLSQLDYGNLDFNDGQIVRMPNRKLKHHNYSFNFKCEHHFKGIAELERFIIKNLDIQS